MNKFDKLIKDIEVFEKIALYGKRSSFLDKLAQMASMPEPNMTPNPNAVVPNKSVDPGFTAAVPEQIRSVNTEPTKPATKSYSSVPKQVQESLNFLSQQAKAPLNLKVDGVLGPETRKALNWFAASNNMTNKNDQELFKAVSNKSQEERNKLIQPLVEDATRVPGPVVS